MMLNNRKTAFIKSFLGFIAMSSIVILRYPNFIIKPRFWAEEASYYEAFRGLDGFLESFNLLIYPAYYLFLNRFAAASASMVDVEYAPLVTSLFGYSIICLPLLIIFFTDSKYWNSINNKLLLSCIYIFSITTGETWFNSTNIGFLVPIFIFLIFLDDNLSSRFKRSFYIVLITVGSISSPIAMIMSPMFYLKYLYKKDKNFFVYCLLFFTATIFHLSYYSTSSYFGIAAEARLDPTVFELSTFFKNVVAFNFVFPFFGYFFSIFFREFFTKFISSDDMFYLLSNLGISTENMSTGFINFIQIFSNAGLIFFHIFFLLFVFAIFKLFKAASLEKKILFLIPYLYLSLTLNIFSLQALGGFRYSIITSFIILFFIYTILIDSRSENNYFIKFILFCSIFIGVIEYKPRIHNYVPDTYIAKKIDWPDWRDEIEVWKLNPNYMPKTWPYIKNKDLLYPARNANESNITCIDLEEPRNWKLMGSRYFSSSAKELITSNKKLQNDFKIVHYSNCAD